MLIIGLSALAVGAVTLYVLANTTAKVGIYQPIKKGAIAPPSFLTSKSLLQIIWEKYVRPVLVAMGIWMAATWTWAIVSWFI